ncbi:MAG: DUF3575 domain-containing protein [Fibrobacterota bacterium]
MMKSLRIAGIILLLALSIHAQPGKTKALTTNPLGMAVGMFNAGYQFEVAPKHALGIEGYFWNPWSIDLMVTGAGFSYNYYSKGGMEGFWFAPSFQVGYASWEYEDYNTSETQSDEALSLGGGATAGYRWTWEAGFTLGLAAGTQFISGEYEGVDFGGVSPSLVFDLGYAF